MARFIDSLLLSFEVQGFTLLFWVDEATGDFSLLKLNWNDSVEFLDELKSWIGEDIWNDSLELFDSLECFGGEVELNDKSSNILLIAVARSDSESFILFLLLF